VLLAYRVYSVPPVLQVHLEIVENGVKLEA
jgi:hypothetical protein